MHNFNAFEGFSRPPIFLGWRAITVHNIIQKGQVVVHGQLSCIPDNKVVYSIPGKEALQSLEMSIHTVCTVQALWAHLLEVQKL